MSSIEQLFVRIFSLLGKAFTVAEPSINEKINQLDKWLDTKSKPS